jgi:hypothetical protein
MEEKFLTLHPDPNKQGVNIHKKKYDQIRNAILLVLNDKSEVLFKDLPGEVEKSLKGKFEGSITWYVTSVKLDLEARNLVERISGGSPQRLRLTQK